jgi:hypothetical protein
MRARAASARARGARETIHQPSPLLLWKTGSVQAIEADEAAGSKMKIYVFLLSVYWEFCVLNLKVQLYMSHREDGSACSIIQCTHARAPACGFAYCLFGDMKVWRTCTKY